MANRTDPAARNIRGGDPQNLIGESLKFKIYQTLLWKSECFDLTLETLFDRAVELDQTGGETSPFMCLILKMLQVQPKKAILVEFIRNKDFKYIRALGAFYMRLKVSYVDVYNYLERLRLTASGIDLYNYLEHYDNWKLKKILADGKFVLMHMNEFVEELFKEDVFGIKLPRIADRKELVEQHKLETRTSLFADYFEVQDEMKSRIQKRMQKLLV